MIYKYLLPWKVSCFPTLRNPNPLMLWSFKFLSSLTYLREGNGSPLQYSCLEKSQKSLVGCCLWGRTGLDTTEWLHFQFSLSCIGEGKGNPLQCPCLENPRVGGAWWAAVFGVAQSRTWLKRLSNSSIYLLFLLLPMLLVSYARNHYQIQCHTVLPLCFLLRVLWF